MSDEQHPLGRTPRHEYNAAASAGWSEMRWASWFRCACDLEREVAPFRFNSEARLADEVEAIYMRLPETSRYLLRIGLTEAVGAWNPVHYSFEVLGRLCWIVAQVRASESIPAMLQILQDYRDLILSGDDATIALSDDLISILAGFVPDATGRIEGVFSDLLFRESVAPQLAATLAVSISTVRPAQFSRSFNRFFLLRQKAPLEFFEDEDVIIAFDRAVPKGEIERQVGELTPNAYEYWMRTCIFANVIPRSALFGIDLEGRPGLADYVFPFVTTIDEVSQARVRYEMAVAAARRPLGYSGAPQDRPSRSAVSMLESVYIAAEQIEDDDAA